MASNLEAMALASNLPFFLYRPFFGLEPDRLAQTRQAWRNAGWPYNDGEVDQLQHFGEDLDTAQKGCGVLFAFRPFLFDSFYGHSSSDGLHPNSDGLQPSSFLLLVVRPGATSSAPSSDALCY